MPNQIQAIKHLRKACKLGVTLSMAEGDADLFFAWPPMPKTMSSFPLMGAAKGADLSVGRKLLVYAIEAGFKPGEIHHVFLSDTTSYTEQDRVNILHGFTEMFKGLWRDAELLKRAGMEEVDINEVCKELENWSHVEGAIVSFPSMVVTLQKSE